MSLYSLKQAAQGVQPWLKTLALGKAVFDYYDSLGDVTINADAVITSDLDGPMVVRRYNDLTIDAATANVTLTTQNRCRGMMLLIDGNLTLQRSGSNVAAISMTGKGARGHSGMEMHDITIPDSVSIMGEAMTEREVLKLIRERGYAIIDRWMWEEWGRIKGVKAVSWTPGTVLVSAANCADGLAGLVVTATQVARTGNSGGAKGLGSGGCGGNGQAATVYLGRSGKAWPCGGGPGACGLLTGVHPICNRDCEDYGGASRNPHASANGPIGGSAGNPASSGANGGAGGGQGVGGVIIIVCKGKVLVQAGCRIAANGMPGGAGGSGIGGSGSGGGMIAVVVPSASTANYENLGTVECVGGAYGGGTISLGAAGGNGNVTGAPAVVTFGDMGW